MESSIELNENHLPNIETIGEDLVDVSSDNDMREPMITNETTDWETFADERSDVWSSDDSSISSINSTPTHIDGNNNCESEVSAKTDNDLRISGGSRLKRKTRIKSAVKSLATIGNRKPRRRGRPNRLYACDWPKCGFTTKYHRHLAYHTNGHHNFKPYVCRRPGCQYRTSWPSEIRKHRLKHNNSRRLEEIAPKLATIDPSLYTIDRTIDEPYMCQWPECGFATKFCHHLVTHINGHNNLKLYACRRLGCQFRTNWRSSLLRHEGRHNH